ncbi:hypothetical protein PABG_12449 [Paracoccidioides brasiliensis Pb03]|nr:hypothetical protein PABG_12449 [Paracoccidioides brasiliensis Pb03]
MIDELNALQAVKTLQQSKTKKKVGVDPNTQFINIERIKKAQEEATALEARKQLQKPEIEAKKAAAAALAAGLEACMFEWQLD